MPPDNQHDQTKKTGQTMFILGWVCLAGLLYLFFDDRLKQQFNPNRTVKALQDDGAKTTVVLKRNKMGHYVTSGHINGVPAVFLLDTGATVVSIPAHLQSRYQLQGQGYSQVNTANGVVQAINTTIDAIAIGPIELHDVRGHLNPGMRSDEILLGMSVLKSLNFSQQGNELRLTLPDVH